MLDEMAQDLLRIERKESDMKGCFELIEREGWGIPLPVVDDKIFLVVPYVSPYGTFSGIKEIQEAFEASLPIDMGQILSIPFIIIGISCTIGGSWLVKLGAKAK